MTQHYKVQTYVPHTHVQNLKTELNKVITPIFPTYDFVFATSTVQGSWRPLAGSNAFQGEVGKIENAEETKLEFTILAKDLETVFATIKKHHPYEKPVVEAFACVLSQ